MPSEINPLIDRNNHLSTLCEHYGKSKNDALEGDLNQVKALINPTELLIIFVAIIVTLAIPWISFFHFFFFFSIPLFSMQLAVWPQRGSLEEISYKDSGNIVYSYLSNKRGKVKYVAIKLYLLYKSVVLL